MLRNNAVFLVLVSGFLLFLGVVYAKGSSKKPVPSLTEVLTQNHDCSTTITIRSQDLSEDQIRQACESLQVQERNFHRLFGTRNKPVKDDYNDRVRINVYNGSKDYQKYAGTHFNMPTDNGGMYLEGIPSNKDNEAEFVAYEQEGAIWNLGHEYVHYLSGRFNVYGDFCASPHDSHDPPENCPEPHPPYPHFVWWEEGAAEYVSGRSISEKTIKVAASKAYTLSELFNTSYHENGGGERVYTWGFLAVKFLLEQHRSKVEQMLVYTRMGDWEGYRKLIAQWGTTLDDEFSVWLDALIVTST